MTGNFRGPARSGTVIYACEKVADMIERDDQLRRQILQIRETYTDAEPPHIDLLLTIPNSPIWGIISL